MSLVRSFVSIFAGKVGVFVLMAAITPVLVRLLGSDGYGDYAFVMSVFGVMMIFVNAGLFDGVRKFIAQDRTDIRWVQRVFGFYVRFGIVLAALGVLGFVLVASSERVMQFFGPEFTRYFYLLAVTTVFYQSFSLARSGLMGLRLERYSEPLTVVSTAVFALVGLPLIYVGYGVTGALVGHLLGYLTVTVASFAVLSRRISLESIFDRTSREIPRAELLTFNSQTVILIFLTASLYHVDILLIRTLVGSQETGYYRGALVIAEFLWFVPMTLQLVLLHSTAQLWAEGRVEAVTRIASTVTRYNVALLLVILIGIAALAEPFVLVYFGAAFEPTVTPLLILLPGVLGFAAARPIFAIGQGRGRLRVIIAATGVAATMNLVLNLVLIPRYGMNGAAIATSVSYGSMFVLHVRAARQIGFDPLVDLRPGRLALTGLGSAVVIFGLAAAIPSTALSLVVVPPVGFVVYSTLVVRLRVIEPDELTTLGASLPAPFDGYLNRYVAFVD